MKFIRTFIALKSIAKHYGHKTNFIRYINTVAKYGYKTVERNIDACSRYNPERLVRY